MHARCTCVESREYSARGARRGKRRGEIRAQGKREREKPTSESVSAMKVEMRLWHVSTVEIGKLSRDVTGVPPAGRETPFVLLPCPVFLRRRRVKEHGGESHEFAEGINTQVRDQFPGSLDYEQKHAAQVLSHRLYATKGRVVTKQSGCFTCTASPEENSSEKFHPQLDTLLLGFRK